MNRRELIAKIQFIPVTAVALQFLAACGNSGNDVQVTPVPTPTPTPQGNPNGNPAADCKTKGAGTQVSFNSGHSHTTNAIMAADINTATEKQYETIPDSSGHTHNFTVAAANFTTLQSNTAVTVSTDPDGTGHSHAITVSCS